MCGKDHEIVTYWIDRGDEGGSFELHPGECRYLAMASVPDPSRLRLLTLAEGLVEAFIRANGAGKSWSLRQETPGGGALVARLVDEQITLAPGWQTIRITPEDAPVEFPELLLELGSWNGKSFLKGAVGQVESGVLGYLDGTIERETDRNIRHPSSLLRDLCGG